MSFGIAFAPLVPPYVLWAACAIALVIVTLLFFVRSRGAAVRAIALALAVLALANPSFTKEDREPLTSVVVVVVDKSPSQTLGDRAAQTEAARASLAERLGRIAGLEVRFVEAGERTARPTNALFSALSAPWPTYRPTALPARSSSPTAVCMTCRPRSLRSASPPRCMR
jgi:hypothetical protein